MTPLGELFASLPPCAACDGGTCADHPAQPSDVDAGRGLVKVWGEQIAARCVDPAPLFSRINVC